MPERFDPLSGELVRLGWTARQIRKVTREVADHWEDLEREGRESGLDIVAAARFADERIGDREALARQFANTMRQSTWWGRHPVVSFVVLPPVALVVWFLAWIISAVTLADLARLMFPGLPNVTDQYLALLWGVHAVHYLGVVFVPAFFWWRARRSYCAAKWGGWACVACAIHGFLNHVALGPHALTWGYGLAMPADWLPVVAPLLVAGLACWHERWRKGRFLRTRTDAASATAGLI